MMVSFIQSLLRNISNSNILRPILGIILSEDGRLMVDVVADNDTDTDDDTDGVFTDIEGVFTDTEGVFTDTEGVFTDTEGVFTDTEDGTNRDFDTEGVFTDTEGVFTDTEDGTNRDFDTEGVFTDTEDGTNRDFDDIDDEAAEGTECDIEDNDVPSFTGGGDPNY